MEFIRHTKTEVAQVELSQISMISWSPVMTSTLTPHPNTNERAVELVKKMQKSKEETMPNPQIYHQALQEEAQHENWVSVAAVLLIFSSVQCSIYRFYREYHERLPPLSYSVDDLNFDGELIQNPEWRRLHARVQRWCLYASTNTNLALVSEAPPLYLDGTFQVCPCLFYQVSTLHAFKCGQQFPLFYFLLPCKSHETYNTSFILLKKAAQSVCIDVDPQRVLTDFELALQQCVAICFSQAKRKRCLYHYTQARWRKVQSLGIQQLYNEDDEFRCFINSVTALAFVPTMFVRVPWSELEGMLIEMSPSGTSRACGMMANIPSICGCSPHIQQC